MSGLQQIPVETSVPFQRATRILIIEDVSIIAQCIENELLDMGYEVIGLASSVDDALEAVRKLRFDLALLDINLDGKDTALVAKSLEERNLPFVVCTGYGGYTNGHHPVVIKPFGSGALKESIEAALASKV